jgi:hypothetical protein
VPLLVVGSLEFVGRFEEHGWKLAATIVPIAYTAWSLWLLAAGIVLLIRRRLWRPHGRRGYDAFWWLRCGHTGGRVFPRATQKALEDLLQGALRTHKLTP